MRGETAALRRLASASLPLALGCGDATTIAENDLERIAQEPAIERALRGFRHDEEGSTCSKLRFVYDPAPRWRGRRPDDYVLERRRAPDGEWRVVASQDGSAAEVLYDATFLPIRGERYEYRARARYLDDGRHVVSSPSEIVREAPRGCVVPRDLELSVYLFSPRDATLPYGREFVEALLFGEGGTGASLSDYYVEVSAGLFAPADARQTQAVRLSGTVHGWYALPGTRNDYCNGEESCSGILARASAEIVYWDVFRELREQNPADYHLVIVNDDAIAHGGGLERGQGLVFVGSGALADASFRVVAHELGHAMGLGERPALSCPERPFPSELLDGASSACRIAAYADQTDPMSGAALVHFNAFSKWVLGFLPGRVLEAALQPGESLEVDLHDATTWAPPEAIQLVLLQVDPYGSHFAIEYRTGGGFNAFARTDPFGPFHALPDGVYVGLRPGTAHPGNLGTGNGPYTAYADAAFREPIVADPLRPFVDPDRGIRVEVLHAADGVSRVRVARE